MCICLYRFQSFFIIMVYKFLTRVITRLWTNRYIYFTPGRGAIPNNCWFWKPSQTSEVTVGWFNEATDCYICNKPLNRDQNIIVRDHDHFQREFRGAVNQACNLQYRIDKKHYKLPVIFYNLRGYDSHLIMQATRKHRGQLTWYQTITNGIRVSLLDDLDFLTIFNSFLIASII